MAINKNTTLIFLIFSLSVLGGFSICFLAPQVSGDSISYLDSMSFLETREEVSGFAPNRLVTTFGGLQLIRLFSGVFGSVLGVWLSMNFIFYLLMGVAFYRLLLLIFESERTAFWGTLFLAGNYSALTFGLAYLMDVGGWAFYVFSLLFSFRYLKFGERREIILASVCVGLGGLFKEYALLGALPIAVILIWENWPSLIRIFKNSWLPALLALLPVGLVYWFIYSSFGYTYLDWLGNNSDYYTYKSRIAEYIKSFGSLLNMLGLIFAGGLWVLSKEWKKLEKENKIFLFAVFVSFLPIFFWPAITQRILFIAVPFVVLISSFLIKKYQKYWIVFLPVLALYLCLSFFMDSFLLNFINLPF